MGDKERNAVRDRLRNPTKGMTKDEKFDYYIERLRTFNHIDEAEFFEQYKTSSDHGS